MATQHSTGAGINDALANSFKFNPAALERNAQQVSSSKLLPPRQIVASSNNETIQQTQRPRGLSNDTSGLQRHTLAPIAHTNAKKQEIKGQ